MGLEVEVKFAVQDMESVRNSLEDCGASWADRFFERNAVFDTPDRSLLHQGVLLRLRRAGGRSTLCLKRPPASTGNRDVKTFDELQTGVEEPEQLESLLLALGFVEAFRYEKLREKWLLGDCLVCLDQLPFGRYVELEGSRAAIFECAEQLKLPAEGYTTKTYHQLNREKRAEHGLSPEESFVFSEADREALIERNDFFC